jgi:hypothetical protein
MNPLVEMPTEEDPHCPVCGLDLMAIRYAPSAARTARRHLLLSRDAVERTVKE